jgi:geranylgeranyl pyrophosphate synthase
LEKIDKDKLIKQEMRKLNKFFKNVPKDKQEMIQGLKEQAAFMYATLMELQEIINDEGPVELFEQGKQRLLREHPASKTYNTMIKNYSSVIKQLIDMLPKEDAKSTEDEFVKFIQKAVK